MDLWDFKMLNKNSNIAKLTTPPQYTHKLTVTNTNIIRHIEPRIRSLKDPYRGFHMDLWDFKMPNKTEIILFNP